jgi:mono/diheme cytochrome c family protein
MRPAAPPRAAFAWLALAIAVLGATGAACAPSAAPTPGPADDNPERGRQIVSATAQPRCGTCHTIPGIEGAVGTIGPSLAGIGSRASERVPGVPANVYLRQSLTEPNAYIVEGFASPSVMPSYREQLNDQELDDVVAFLLTLR